MHAASTRLALPLIVPQLASKVPLNGVNTSFRPAMGPPDRRLDTVRHRYWPSGASTTTASTAIIPDVANLPALLCTETPRLHTTSHSTNGKKRTRVCTWGEYWNAP